MTEDLLVKHEKLIGRLSCFDIDLSVKSVRIWSYYGPHFPAFGLNMERYFVSLRIQSEFRKMSTSFPAHLFTIMRNAKNRLFFKLLWGQGWEYNSIYRYFYTLDGIQKCTIVFKLKQETIRVLTIVMICSTLVSLGKIQYFRRPTYNPAEQF